MSCFVANPTHSLFTAVHISMNSGMELVCRFASIYNCSSYNLGITYTHSVLICGGMFILTFWQDVLVNAPLEAPRIVTDKLNIESHTRSSM